MDQRKGSFDTLADGTVHVNGENVHVNSESVHVKSKDVHVNGKSLKRKERIKQLYQLVAENPGMNHQQLAKILGVTPKTIGRYVQALGGKIQYQGSDKTGGYHVVEELLVAR
jgi:predicted HTH transcriptional regulator